MPLSQAEQVNQEVVDVLDDLLLKVILQAPEEDRIDEVSVEHVFDYDGCLGDYDGEEMPEEIQVADDTFWQDLKDSMHAETEGLPCDRRYISIGTARQSKGCDDRGIEVNHSPSCFPIYRERAEFLGAMLDEFLLADVREDLPACTSFARIMDSSYQEAHASWSFDESKITLIYAKAHRAATFNPNGTVQLTFYDDRQDILGGLWAFFSENAALLPDNLVLHLCEYRRGQGILYEYAPLDGIHAQNSLGIDFQYENTVRELGFSLDRASFERVPAGSETVRPLNIPEIQAFGLETLIYYLRRTHTATPQLGHMLFTPPSATVDTVQIEDAEEAEAVRRASI
jgi:hypothetical protein